MRLVTRSCQRFARVETCREPHVPSVFLGKIAPSEEKLLDANHVVQYLCPVSKQVPSSLRDTLTGILDKMTASNGTQVHLSRCVHGQVHYDAVSAPSL